MRRSNAFAFKPLGRTRKPDPALESPCCTAIAGCLELRGLAMIAQGEAQIREVRTITRERGDALRLLWLVLEAICKAVEAWRCADLVLAAGCTLLLGALCRKMLCLAGLFSQAVRFWVVLGKSLPPSVGFPRYGLSLFRRLSLARLGYSCRSLRGYSRHLPG